MLVPVATELRPTFDGFMRLVDVYLVDQCGLDSGSLEDWRWAACWAEGFLPIVAVEAFLWEHGFKM